MMAGVTHKAVIDRIEGELAVVVLDDDKVKFNLPVKYLPEGVAGGDHLHITFNKDDEARAKTKGRIEQLLKELKGPGK
jgi:hypothetical protein